MTLVVVHASTKGDVGQVQPVVRADWLTDAETREWSEAKWAPEVWTARFQEIRARGAGLEITDASLRTSTALHKTPMKIRQTSPTSESSPFEKIETPFSPVPALKTKAITDNSVAEDLQMLHGVLGSLGTKLSQATKDSSDSRIRGTMLALKLNALEAEVGDHPEVLSETTVWGGLGAVNDSVEDIKSLVKLVVERVGAADTVLQQHLNSFAVETQTLVDRWCSQWMPPEVQARLVTMAAAGSGGSAGAGMVPALEAEVASLRREVQGLRMELSKFPNHGGGTPASSGLAEAVTLELQSLALRIDAIAKDQGLLRGLLDSTAITVAEQTITSLSDAVLLVERLTLREFPFLATTPMTLLEVAASGEEVSFLQNRKNEASLGIQPLESPYFSAFRVECPTSFGDGKSPYLLSKVVSYADWDNKNLTKPSVRTSVMSKVKEAVRRVKTAIDQTGLSLPAKELLRSFLSSSVDFLTSFFQWISDFYDLYHDQSSMTSEHVWELVQFLVRSVFADFCKLSIPVRDLSPGTACRDPSSTGRMFYMAFQCHKLATDYLDCEWDGHVTMSPAINKFLLRSVGMKDHILEVQTSLEAKLSELHTEVKSATAKAAAAQKAAQQAQSTADKSASSKGKGGKRDGESA